MSSRALACAALLLTVSCSRVSTGGTGRHDWTQAGILRIAVSNEPKNVNPLLASSEHDVFIDRLMFEPLVTADPRGNALPMLAVAVPDLRNGGISRDGLTIVYHLRRDVRWTDGLAVTARDVKWSWQAIVNPNNNVISRHGYDIVRAIDTPDDHTVVVHLKARFAPFVNTFFAESDQPYNIVPAHVLARYPNINQVQFNERPDVSDGPFRFDKWIHGDRIDLRANPSFFKGKPRLDRILISFVPDENTEINLLRTHAVDFVEQPTINTYLALKGIPGTRVLFVNVNGYDGLQLNLDRPALADPSIRLAIAYALDKRSLVKTLTFGQERAALEDIPDWMWAYDPSVPARPYSIATAKRLLARAGWRSGGDGILRRNGQPLTLLLVCESDNATHRKESLLIQDALRSIGIEVEVKYYPSEMVYATAGLGGILQTGKFDIAPYPWYAGVDPDDSSQFLCAMRPPNGYNTSRYCNPEMEAAQSVALTSYDPATRKGAYSHIQRLLARDNPDIFFWYQRQQEAISVDFKNFAPNPVTESWNAWEWSI
ncbi:MAG: peptide ABC transporter substrate-binding protein [Candidatus Eremiobacteraeota bacterium]|nr:peptide ABC transporter substrate-binding protein [Candidatus Eremiobacteraeota bacterium]